MGFLGIFRDSVRFFEIFPKKCTGFFKVIYPSISPVNYVPPAMTWGPFLRIYVNVFFSDRKFALHSK